MRDPNMTLAQERAVTVLAKAFGWEEKSTHDLGLMLWALFRYYVRRLR